MTKAETKKKLNEELKKILKTFVISWENYEEIKKMNKIIKSDNIYNKQSLINKHYGKK